MENLLRRAFYWIILLAICRAASADTPPEVLDKGKRATALVEVGNSHGFGSSFCIDPNGFFLTSISVVPERGNNEIRLILHSGETDQRKLKAKVIRTDPALGLALLFVEKPGPLTALPLADVSSLIETASVFTFSYPSSKSLSLGKEEYPGIMVSTGHVTSLRKVNGDIRELQSDTSVNPGDSGGPVLNSKGQVVGLMMPSPAGSHVAFAAPVNIVSRFLSGMSLAFSPGEMTTAQAREAHDFEIKIAALRRSTADMTAELTFSAGLSDHRKFPARIIDASTFRVRAAPLPAAMGKSLLRVIVKDAHSELTCQILDQKVLVDGKLIFLSALSKIERGDKTIVTFVNKEVREAKVTGLEDVETTVFGGTLHHVFSHAESITILGVEPPLASIAYQVQVRQSGRVVGDLAGEISLTDALGGTPLLASKADLELLIVSFDSDEVKRFNGRTGVYIDDFASGSGLSRPAGIVIGPDGNLYVSSSNSNTILRYNGRTGQFIDVFVDRERNGGLTSPQGLTFGPDGNLYVCGTWSNDVKRYNGRTGAFMGDFIAANAGMEHPNFLMFGPDGNLYVSASPRSVKRYNGRTGAYISDFVSSNGISGPGQFCFGTDGRFYLCSYDSRQIKRFDSQTGAFIDNFVTPEAIGTGGPVGLSFGADGNLYVSMRGGNDIRRFNGKTGEYMDTFASGNGLNFPTFLLFRPSVKIQK